MANKNKINIHINQQIEQDPDNNRGKENLKNLINALEPKHFESLSEIFANKDFKSIIKEGFTFFGAIKLAFALFIALVTQDRFRGLVSTVFSTLLKNGWDNIATSAKELFVASQDIQFTKELLSDDTFAERLLESKGHITSILENLLDVFDPNKQKDKAKQPMTEEAHALMTDICKNMSQILPDHTATSNLLKMISKLMPGENEVLEIDEMLEIIKNSGVNFIKVFNVFKDSLGKFLPSAANGHETGMGISDAVANNLSTMISELNNNDINIENLLEIVEMAISADSHEESNEKAKGCIEIYEEFLKGNNPGMIEKIKMLTEGHFLENMISYLGMEKAFKIINRSLNNLAETALPQQFQNLKNKMDEYTRGLARANNGEEEYKDLSKSKLEKAVTKGKRNLEEVKAELERFVLNNGFISLFGDKLPNEIVQLMTNTKEPIKGLQNPGKIINTLVKKEDIAKNIKQLINIIGFFQKEGGANDLVNLFRILADNVNLIVDQIEANRNNRDDMKNIIKMVILGQPYMVKFIKKYNIDLGESAEVIVKIIFDVLLNEKYGLQTNKESKAADEIANLLNGLGDMLQEKPDFTNISAYISNHIDIFIKATNDLLSDDIFNIIKKVLYSGFDIDIRALEPNIVKRLFGDEALGKLVNDDKYKDELIKLKDILLNRTKGSETLDEAFEIITGKLKGAFVGPKSNGCLLPSDDESSELRERISKLAISILDKAGAPQHVKDIIATLGQKEVTWTKLVSFATLKTVFDNNALNAEVQSAVEHIVGVLTGWTFDIGTLLKGGAFAKGAAWLKNGKGNMGKYEEEFVNSSLDGKGALNDNIMGEVIASYEKNKEQCKKLSQNKERYNLEDKIARDYNFIELLRNREIAIKYAENLSIPAAKEITFNISGSGKLGLNGTYEGCEFKSINFNKVEINANTSFKKCSFGKIEKNIIISKSATVNIDNESLKSLIGELHASGNKLRLEGKCLKDIFDISQLDIETVKKFIEVTEIKSTKDIFGNQINADNLPEPEVLKHILSKLSVDNIGEIKLTGHKSIKDLLSYQVKEGGTFGSKLKNTKIVLEGDFNRAALQEVVDFKKTLTIGKGFRISDGTDISDVSEELFRTALTVALKALEEESKNSSTVVIKNFITYLTASAKDQKNKKILRNIVRLHFGGNNKEYVLNTLTKAISNNKDLLQTKYSVWGWGNITVYNTDKIANEMDGIINSHHIANKENKEFVRKVVNAIVNGCDDKELIDQGKINEIVENIVGALYEKLDIKQYDLYANLFESILKSQNNFRDLGLKKVGQINPAKIVAHMINALKQEEDNFEIVRS